MAEQGQNQEPMKPKKKMSKGKLVLLVIALVIVWFLAVQVVAADRYEAVVNVVEGDGKVGVNPTAERLDFGDLSRDTASSRFVTLNNSGQCFLCLKGGGKYIMVWKFGSIAELMKVSRNNFTLEPGAEERLEFSVYAPVSAPYGKYKGKVWVFKWPKLF